MTKQLLIKLNIIKRLFLLIGFVLLSTNGFSQVTIGSGIPPEKAALLEIKDQQAASDGYITSTTGGLLLPRVSLVDRNELFPFFDSSLRGDNDYEEKQKPAHTGLMVYHVGENDLAKGAYLWDGQEWKQIEESMGKSDFTLNCSDIKVQGTYVVDQSMNTANFLEMKVTVTKPGSYNITGTTGNNYIFLASGEFYVAGEYTITAAAQGTPQAVRTDSLSLMNFGEEIDSTCKPTIVVSSNVADYNLLCSSTVVKGIYKVNQELNANTNYLELSIYVNSIGSYSISSNSVDGISFYASGEFTKTGIQTIQAYGQGTPKSTATKIVTLTTNSIGGTSTTCDVNVLMVIPQKRILSIGSTNRSLSGTNSKGNAYHLIHSEGNFGLSDTSTFRTETPEIVELAEKKISTATLRPYIQPSSLSDKPVDIVYITYDADLVPDSTYAAGNMLADYVRKGGVVIMFNEHMFTHESGAPGKFIQQLFNDSAATGTEDALSGGWIFKLPNYDDIILNGPFGDIRNKYIGEDAGFGDIFNYLPSSEIEWSVSSYDYSGYSGGGGSTAQTAGFKAKNYNLVWFGDGGVGSGNGASNTTTYPVALDSNNKPISKQYGRNNNSLKDVENARFIANLLCWAFQQAEFSGINTK